MDENSLENSHIMDFDRLYAYREETIHKYVYYLYT